jgi:hypothetical protein
MRLTQIPENVFKALACGDINLTQYAVLGLMHRWADYQTGCIKSFSAARVLAALDLDVTEANLRKMQRTLRTLRNAGWYHDDYRNGDKRPYNAWLSNYSVAADRNGSPNRITSNRRQNADSVADGDGEEAVLNPSEVKPCANESDTDVVEDVEESDEELSLKHHIKDQADKVKTENLKASSSDEDVLQLLEFVWETCRFIRTKKWAARLLQTYSLNEIRYAIVMWLYQQYSGVAPTNAEALKIFFEEGVETVIHVHRKRVASRFESNPPREWKEFLEDQLAADEQVASPPQDSNNQSNQTSEGAQQP